MDADFLKKQKTADAEGMTEPCHLRFDEPKLSKRDLRDYYKNGFPQIT
jgi:hypothetical protein